MIPALLALLIAAGAGAPPFSLPTIDGKRVALQDFRGKTLVINTWATWCPPCRQETPDMIAAYKQLHASDVVFLGIDSSEDPALVRTFVASKGVGWQQALDPQHSFADAYGVEYIPTTFVIDPNGIVRARFTDVMTPSLLRSFIASARAGKNVVVTSALQRKIDTMLDPSRQPSLAAAVATVNKADAIVNNDTDPQKGLIADLVRTHSEEAALLDAALSKYGNVAKSRGDHVLVSRARGDAASAQLRWNEAIAAYDAALALDPKNPDLLESLAFASSSAKDYAGEAVAYQRLTALRPNDPVALLELALAYSKRADYDRSLATFARALEAAKAAPLRKQANIHLYYGRTLVKAGRPEQARAEFAKVTQVALRLPKTDERYALFLETAQEATAALSERSETTAISLAPWTGVDLPTSSTGTFKYRLALTGKSGRDVALHTGPLPKHWIASFCTDRICAPFKTTITLPDWGVSVIEFQLIPPDERTKRPVAVRVLADDGISHLSAGVGP